VLDARVVSTQHQRVRVCGATVFTLRNGSQTCLSSVTSTTAESPILERPREETPRPGCPRARRIHGTAQGACRNWGCETLFDQASLKAGVTEEFDALLKNAARTLTQHDFRDLLDLVTAEFLTEDNDFVETG